MVAAAPFWTMIPMNGAAVEVPLEVTPVRLTDATVLLAIVVSALGLIPLKTIPANFPVEPLSAYVPVCALLAKPMMLPVMVKPWAPEVAVALPISIGR